MPGTRPNTAPQTGILQNLTDPTIINILPGEVVNRDAINKPPPQPDLRILGQNNGQQNGQNGQTTNPPAITRINGMPPAGETRFVPDRCWCSAADRCRSRCSTRSPRSG